MLTYPSSNNLSCLLWVPYSKNFQLCLCFSPFHPPIHPALPSGILCQSVLDATSQTYIIPAGLLCGSQCDGHPEPCEGFAETLALSGLWNPDSWWVNWGNICSVTQLSQSIPLRTGALTLTTSPPHPDLRLASIVLVPLGVNDNVWWQPKRECIRAYRKSGLKIKAGNTASICRCTELGSSEERSKILASFTHPAFPCWFHKLEVPACKGSPARPSFQLYCGFPPFAISLQQGQARVFN